MRRNKVRMGGQNWEGREGCWNQIVYSGDCVYGWDECMGRVVTFFGLSLGWVVGARSHLLASGFLAGYVLCT